MSVPITPGTGASSVAGEVVGGLNYQQIEVYGAGGASTLAINPDGSLKTSIIGTPTVTLSGSPSISGAVTVIGTPSVTVGGRPSISGAVNITGNSSILTVHVIDDQIVSSMVAIVTDTIIHGKTTAGGGAYVEVKVDPSGAIVTAMSSIVSFQGGNQVTSLVSTVPSSVIVGTSIFGQLPAGTAPIGSVAALQGTNPWIMTGSIQGTVTAQQGTNAGLGSAWPVKITNTTQTANVNAASMLSVEINNTTASTIALVAPLTSRIQGTADFRTNAASIAALPAGGGGVRNYVDHVQVSNFGPSSVLVLISDNTTSTLGWTIAPAGGGSNYDVLYRGAANSPITASISGVASVLVSMQGFTSGT